MSVLKKYPEPLVFGLDIGTRSIVGTIGYKERDKFVIIAQCTKFHDTRSMLDGQIHDISVVAREIEYVKEQLEGALGDRKLKEVCIAAAGRVLKTAACFGEYTFSDTTVVNREYIHSLDLIGVEKAHEKIIEENGNEVKFYCVGYTIIKYYLNGYEITSLEGHKANKIGADVLATFLPEEVVDGLYAAVNMAGLEVANLTLEPIAAINVAIPVEYRLLNIGLVDIGAGTSDICITKDGSIIGYGMLPSAGDEITETILKKYLVDFKTAEKIKMISPKRKTMTYKDIMGINHKVTPDEVYKTIDNAIKELANGIASKIIELNGGKSINAVFVVGGGGKIPGFTNMLAKALGIAKDRVALRGEEVLGNVEILVDGVKKDPLLVTPIGICLNFFDQKNNFIFVQVNGERIKLYNNDKLTVFDAAVAYGLPNEDLFPKRGKDIEYTVNGIKRMIRGQAGEACIITIDGNPASMNHHIEANEKIVIQPSTIGSDAIMKLGKVPEFKNTIKFFVNNHELTCPKFANVNGKLESEYYDIKDGDDIEILSYYTLGQLLTFMDISPEGKISVNNEEANEDTKIYENFKVDWSISIKFSDLLQDDNVDDGLINKDKTNEEISNKKFDVDINSKDKEVINKDSNTKDVSSVGLDDIQGIIDTKHDEIIDLPIIINGKPILLKGKASYVFVDIFDFYEFDLTHVGGSELVMTIDGKDAGHFTPLYAGADIKLYWKG